MEISEPILNLKDKYHRTKTDVLDRELLKNLPAMLKLMNMIDGIPIPCKAQNITLEFSYTESLRAKPNHHLAFETKTI